MPSLFIQWSLWFTRTHQCFDQWCVNLTHLLWKLLLKYFILCLLIKSFDDLEMPSVHITIIWSFVKKLTWKSPKFIPGLLEYNELLHTYFCIYWIKWIIIFHYLPNMERWDYNSHNSSSEYKPSFPAFSSRFQLIFKNMFY